MEIDKNYPVLLKKKLDCYMVGNEQYKEAVCMALYQFFKNKKRTNILVIGPTGTGKSYLFECLPMTKLMPKKHTVMYYNVSRLTEEGVVGPGVKEMLMRFKEQCKAEGNASELGIIFCDEIDKIIKESFVSVGGSVENKNAAVQHQLMQILDGGTVEGVDTKKILFVFGGAFTGIDNANEEQTREIIGFGAKQEKLPDQKATESIRERLIEYGFQREFLGRIGQIIELEKLSRKELKAILLHPTNGVLPRLQQEFLAEGIELVVEPAAINELIDMIDKENLGARSVRNVMTRVLDGCMFKCFEKGYDKIIVNKESIRDGFVKYGYTEKEIIKDT